MLIHPDFAKKFMLQADASEVGRSMVLSQNINGEVHLVGYLSKKLFLQDTSYSVIEKEALALKWAMDILRYYLWGNPFKLVTDCALLHWLNTLKDTNPRIMRGYLSLQPYNFEILHSVGKDNKNTGFFSRDEEVQESQNGALTLALRWRLYRLLAGQEGVKEQLWAKEAPPLVLTKHAQTEDRVQKSARQFSQGLTSQAGGCTYPWSSHG